MRMKKNEENYYYQGNNVADIIKALSIVDLILFVILACMEENFIFVVIGIISSIFIYALGEIIELLDNTKENTEHVRDYVEELKNNEIEDKV